MNYKIVLSGLIFIFLSGCNLKNENLPMKEPIVIKKEKQIVYEREKISEELKLFIKKIIKLFVSYDLKKINEELINPSFGFYDFYKYEGNISFTHQTQIYNIIEEETEELNHIISRVEKESINYVIIEQDLKFDCSPFDDAYYGWNGEGLYLSDKTNTILSELMQETNKYQPDRYKKSDLEKAKFIEKTSYKVILTPKLVFYVSKIEDKWYITLFDRISTNCSS